MKERQLLALTGHSNRAAQGETYNERGNISTFLLLFPLKRLQRPTSRSVLPYEQFLVMSEMEEKGKYGIMFPSIVLQKICLPIHFPSQPHFHPLLNIELIELILSGGL